MTTDSYKNHKQIECMRERKKQVWSLYHPGLDVWESWEYLIAIVYRLSSWLILNANSISTRQWYAFERARSRTCSCFCSNIRTHGKVMMIESIGARLEYINSIYVTQKQIAFSLPCYCRNWMSTDNIEVHSHGAKRGVFDWNSTHEFKRQTNNQKQKLHRCPKVLIHLNWISWLLV